MCNQLLYISLSGTFCENRVSLDLSMKDRVILLLCAVALAHGFDQDLNRQQCNCDPSEAQQICEANYGSDNVQIAHENCDKFYKCAHGKPVAFTCQANLLYDPVLGICNWPHEVDCGDRPISDGTDSADPDCDDNTAGENDNGAGNDNDGTCNCDPSEAPSICAAEGSNGVFVAHENCNQFYLCANGRPEALVCPAGLLYNPFIRDCDWPHSVECGDRVIPKPDDNPVTDNNNGGNDNDNNDGTCNCNPEEAPSICAAPDSEGVLVAHENCNQYYICNYGKPVAFLCPSKLLFNPYMRECDWPQNVDCGDRLVPEPENNCPSCNGGVDSDDIDDLPLPGDDIDNVPPQGDDGGNDIDDLPPQGDAGNDNNGGNNPGSVNGGNENVGGGNCNPSEAPTICAADESDDVLIAHENCNKYYICHGGKPIARPCPGNLLFNPNTDQCDWPENVDCGDRVIPGPDDSNNGNGNGGSDNGGGGDGGNDNGDNGVVGGGNCDPSEAPTICAADESDDVLIAHENCNKYYICHGGKPIARPCPGNLLFNPNTDQCDWPENVDCGDRVIPGPDDSDNGNGNGGSDNGGSDNGAGGDGGNDNGVVGGGNCDPSEAPTICAADESDDVLIAHENCNKYYICHGGKPIARPCPGNLLFNPNTDQCDWPENVDCGDRVIPGPDDSDNGNGNGGSDNGGSDNGGGGDGGNDNGDNGVVGGGNCDPSEAPTICAADESDDVLIAHENCNKYYICHGGKPIARPCPGNLLFNPNTDQCDWPENVDCGDRVIPGPDDSNNGNGNGGSDNGGSDNGGGGDGGNDNGDNGVVGGGNCDPSEAPTICAADESDDVLIAHENCNKYYICHGGKPIARPCPGNLLFNPNTDQCDWPENVDCGDKVIPGPDDSDNGNGNGGSDNGGSDNGAGGDGGNDNGVVGGGNCDPSEAPTICAADESDDVLIAHENCNKYYICHGGKPIARPCPGNLLFNPNTDQCDWPENVDCGDRVIPGPDDSNNGNGNGGSDNGGSDNGAGGDGGNDNGVVGGGNCDPSEAPTICAADESDDVLIAHENCNKYYICHGGKPIARPCPGNLLFNPNTDQCDWPENVDCGDRVIPGPDDSDNGNGNGGSDNGGSDNGADGDGGNDNGVVGGGNCDPSEAPTICAADESDDVLIAHENCNKYYICHGGKPIARPCPGNLLFNPNTDQCDWPENVDCGDRVIPGPDDSDNGNGNGGSDNGSSDNGGGGDGGNDNGVVGGGNCDPSEAPTICAADESDDVLIAHENCNKYYICHGGKPIARPCPGNLLFNPNTDQCDWPENVDCVIPGPDDSNNGNGNGGSDNGGSDNGAGGDGGNDNGVVGGGNCDPSEAPTICAADESDDVLIAHENCNKYYICHGGKPIARPCPGNLLFNPNTDQCDWPENVDCGDRVIPGPDDSDNGNGNGGSDNGGSDNGADGDGGNDNGVVGGGNCDPSEAPTICAADESDDVLIAHENCNKYYICHGGKPIARPCPGNLLFNPNTDQCDWPENVDCGDRVIPGPDDSDNGNGNGGSDNGSSDNGGGGDGGNENGDNGVVGGGNCDPSEAPTICAADESDDVLIAHENCNKYYICHGGKPIARPCPGNLLFNPNTDQCDWPENVDCGDRVIPGPDDSNNGNGNGGSDNGGGGDGGNDNGDNGVVGGGNCDPSEAPTICAADESDDVLIAHENCNKYYICHGGKPIARPCPGNLLFNPNTDQCDWPENVDCGDRVIPGPDDSNNGNGNGGSDNGGSDNGGGGDGGNDNGDNGVVGGGNCDPSEAPTICAADESDDVLIAHENCNKYYICHGGKPIARPCPGNLLFNPNTDQCDWPENVDCGDKVIPGPDDSENGNGNGGSDNGGSDNGAGGDGGNDNGVVGGGNCDPSEAPTICAADESDDVLIAHENCNKYYICHGGKPIARPCPGNLLFNPNTDQCDWPENVDCGDRVIPGPDDSDNGNGNGGSDNGSSDNGGGGDGGNENGDNGVVGGGNCDPSEAPTICAADESDDVLIAHENCNKYYICHGGKPIARPCPGNLLFNPNTDQCDWPENVDCGDRVIPGPDDSNNGNGNGGSDNGGGGDGGNDNGDNGVVGGGNCDPSEAPTICAADESDDVLIAHENCNKYYICHGGKPIARPCPGNLLFNPNTDQCDWPENVDCGDRVIPGPDDSNNGNGNGGSDNGGSDNGGGGDGGNDNGDNGVVGGGNCDPSEAPTICAADESDDVLIAHENCNKYYICHGGKPIARPCPGNLLFNPNTDQCDWPENVDCGDKVIPGPDDSENGNGNGGSDNGGSDNGAGGDGGNDNGVVGGGNCDPSEAPTICAADESDDVLIAHENCNKYYICHGGKPIARPCPGNLLFNPNTDQCDWPENVDCGDRVIPGPDDSNNGNGNGGSDNGGSDNGAGGDGGNDNGVVGGGNCDPSEAPTICAADESDDVLIAHENCNKYYICHGGKPIARPCPGNLLFNPNTDQCDWPENVDCGDRVIPGPDDSDNGNGNGGSDNGGSDNGADGDGGNDNGVVGGGNCDPSEAPTICAADESDDVLIAHENCNKYYICHGGKPIARPCPGNLLFNPNTDQCDWPENVDCGDRVIPGPDDSDNGNGNGGSDNGSSDNGGGGDGGNDNGVVGGGNCDPSEAPTICAADESDDVLIAHENCNKYYICHGGKPIARPCPGNLLFNPNTDQCDWPENVDCGDRVIPGPDDSNNGNGNGGSDNGGSDNGAGGDGGNDNGVVGGGNCDPSEAPTICAADESDDVLIAHENCNKYYICHGGKPIARPCPGNLLFNPNTDQCDWPENVDCGDRVIPGPDDSDNGNGNGGSDNGGSDNGADGDGGNDNGVVGGGNCDPSEAPTICAADESDDVLIAHENCNKYYICHGGKPIARPCPGNLLFNPNTDQCDWPENVDCGDRVIPGPDDSDNGNGNGGSDNGSSDNGGGGDGGNENGDNGVVGGGNCDPSEAPTICAADESDDVLIAHENCNKYYICHGGKPIARPCPGNLLFNPNTDQCDWPENVDCGDRVIPGPDDSNNGGDNGGSDNDGSDNGGSDNGGGDNGNDNEGICNCNPGEAPQICLADNSNGTLIAHENCDHYYICNHGKPVAMPCPENLLYNPFTEECDWPENVDCGHRNVPDSDDSNDNQNDIDDLPAAGDDPGSDIDDLPPVGVDPGNDNDGSDCDNDNNNNDEPCNCRPEDAPSICAVGGSDGAYIAHENCNQYYQCSNGRPVAQKCPSGLLYNPVTITCDWPQNVDCGDRIIPDPDEDNNVSESDEVDNGDNDNGGTCNCNPEEAPAICAADGSSDVMIAHENCNQFYKCANGIPVAFKCSANLLYNPYKEDCDWPENVECGNRVIPDPDDDDNNNSGNDNDSGPGADDNQVINDDPSQAPSICADGGSDGVLVAHENCNQYYVCSAGRPVAMPCSTGLFFNPIIRHCDWPQNVVCGDRAVPDDDCVCNPRNAPKLCAKPNSDGLLVAHEDCSQFYMCVAGVPVPWSCPSSLMFNADKTVCDWPQNVDCSNRMLPFVSLNKHLESRQSLRK